jgi:hypothetical protein
VSLVAEENAVRAIAAMAEQTAGLRVDELLLPEDYLQEYKDSTAQEEDPEETEVDELTEETEEEISESDYDDGEDGGKGKGKAREKVKTPTKSAKGNKTKSKKKPKPAGQVLNELVGCSCSYLRFWLTVP